MSQDDILQWLRDHPGWHKRHDIAVGLDRSYDYLDSSLHRLSKQGEIEVRAVEKRVFEYRYKEG